MNQDIKGRPVKTNRGFYDHFGILLNDGTVVELAKPSEGGRVRRVSFDEFARGNRVVFVSSDSDLPPETIARRALSQVGRSGYRLLSRNCEHFARWSSTGRWKSSQVGAATSIALFGLGILALSTALRSPQSSR